MCVVRCRNLIVLAALAVDPVAVLADSVSPESVGGLQAWYRIEALHAKLRNGDDVRRWQDASGNAHHLTEEGKGQPAKFRTLALNGNPAVEIGQLTSFAVDDPFVLEDHTIFLVYGSKAQKRALFSSDQDDHVGIVLRDDGSYDQIQQGLGKWRYNDARSFDHEFAIAVLSRRSGVLRYFLDGADASGGGETGIELRVGRFFHLRNTTAVARDGAGLSIVEMLFYDRHLTEDERRSVESHLAEKYGIELLDSFPAEDPAQPIDWDDVEVLARLVASADGNLNGDLVPVTWNREHEVKPPFRHSPSEQPSRLYCTKDGTRVHLSVALTLAASEPGARLRVWVQKNYEDYLEQHWDSRPDPEDPEGKRLSVALDASLGMNDGDFIEIITERIGGDATVVAQPDRSTLMATAQ